MGRKKVSRASIGHNGNTETASSTTVHSSMRQVLALSLLAILGLPSAGLMTPHEGLIWRFYHYGIQWEIIPPLIFLGIGAL
ncbi:MAG: hypothetical protein SWE60_23300, partial [Thermodesulfobacteriota bacterium]|nr:hypothetical protein [Thermodesulfobacteriota bacterium]